MKLHLTVAIYLLDQPADRVLLAHHRRFDAWLPLGGHLEPGERPHEAAARELREEAGAGLAVEWGSPFLRPRPVPGAPPGHLHYGEYEDPYEGERALFQVHSFVARLLSSDHTPRAHDEHHEQRWFNLRQPSTWPALRPHVQHTLRHHLGDVL